MSTCKKHGIQYIRRCDMCHKKANKAWYEKNRDRVIAAAAKWKINHPDANRLCYIKHRKKRLAEQVEYKKKNKEKIKIINAEYHKKNPEASHNAKQKRRKMVTENGGRLSKGLAEKLFKLQKGKCPCCKKPLGNKYELDHKTPLALGGANEDWNMQLLRVGCNRRKSKKHPIDFMQERGFLL